MPERSRVDGGDGGSGWKSGGCLGVPRPSGSIASWFLGGFGQGKQGGCLGSKAIQFLIDVSGG